MTPRVSIIVPCKSVNGYCLECIRHCQLLDYPNLEILVSPDQADGDLAGATVYASGATGPAEKRDMLVRRATGELLAFIDDDAYPAPFWLREAVKHFEREDVAAVGGPAVTPPEDSLLQRASGVVYSSFLGSGTSRYRYVPGRLQCVDDYPSCNFIVRKSIFEELGGFCTSYWPGEDTKLCMEITGVLGKRIVYDPDVLVYHHRRKLFGPHLKQIWNYAVHRGYFAKRFGRTSLRVSYFVPSLLVLGVVVGAGLSFVGPVLRLAFVTVMGLYLLAVLASSLQPREWKVAPLAFAGIVATHITYGVGFIKGLLTRNLEK